MTKNMGTADRILRLLLVVLAVVLIATKVVTGTLAIVVGIIGAVLLVTSLVGFCGLYKPFKISTIKKSETKQDQAAGK